MNKRGKKKADKRRRAVVHRILDAVLDINGLEPRRKELEGNLPAAFFTFSGHVSEVSVGLHEYGWEIGDKESFSEYGYLYPRNNRRNAEYVLESIRKEAVRLETKRRKKGSHEKA